MLDLRSMGHPTVVMLCCSAESGLECSALQRIHPSLRSSNMKKRIYFQQLQGSSLVLFLRMKTIIQAMSTLPPLALTAVPAGCATRSPGKHAHREFPGEQGWGMGMFVLSQKSPHRDTLPWHLCPGHCKRQMTDYPRPEDSFPSSKSCSKTSCEAHGQQALYLPRAMRSVETWGQNL